MLANAKLQNNVYPISFDSFLALLKRKRIWSFTHCPCQKYCYSFNQNFWSSLSADSNTVVMQANSYQWMINIHIQHFKWALCILPFQSLCSHYYTRPRSVIESFQTKLKFGYKWHLFVTTGTTHQLFFELSNFSLYCRKTCWAKHSNIYQLFPRGVNYPSGIVCDFSKGNTIPQCCSALFTSNHCEILRVIKDTSATLIWVI